MAHVLDHVELDPELCAGCDYQLGPLAAAGEGCMGHAQRASRARWHGSDRGEVDARRHDFRLRDPARRIVRAHDLGVGAPAVGELVRRLAADVRADEMEDRLLAGCCEDRELRELGHQRESEVEVEDVGGREEPREGAELRGLPAPDRAFR